MFVSIFQVEVIHLIIKFLGLVTCHISKWFKTIKFFRVNWTWYWIWILKEPKLNCPGLLIQQAKAITHSLVLTYFPPALFTISSKQKKTEHFNYSSFRSCMLPNSTLYWDFTKIWLSFRIFTRLIVVGILVESSISWFLINKVTSWIFQNSQNSYLIIFRACFHRKASIRLNCFHVLN